MADRFHLHYTASKCVVPLLQADCSTTAMANISRDGFMPAFTAKSVKVSFITLLQNLVPANPGLINSRRNADLPMNSNTFSIFSLPEIHATTPATSNHATTFTTTALGLN